MLKQFLMIVLGIGLLAASSVHGSGVDPQWSGGTSTWSWFFECADEVVEFVLTTQQHSAEVYNEGAPWFDARFWHSSGEGIGETSGDIYSWNYHAHVKEGWGSRPDRIINSQLTIKSANLLYREHIIEHISDGEVHVDNWDKSCEPLG